VDYPRGRTLSQSRVRGGGGGGGGGGSAQAGDSAKRTRAPHGLRVMRFPGLKTLRISDANNCISRAYGRRQLRVASRDVKTSSTGAPGALALPRGMSILSRSRGRKNERRTAGGQGGPRERTRHTKAPLWHSKPQKGKGEGERREGAPVGRGGRWSVVRPRGTAYTAVLFQYFKRTPGHHTYHGRPIFEVREGRGGG